MTVVSDRDLEVGEPDEEPTEETDELDAEDSDTDENDDDIEAEAEAEADDAASDDDQADDDEDDAERDDGEEDDDDAVAEDTETETEFDTDTDPDADADEPEAAADQTDEEEDEQDLSDEDEDPTEEDLSDEDEDPTDEDPTDEDPTDEDPTDEDRAGEDSAEEAEGDDEAPVDDVDPDPTESDTGDEIENGSPQADIAVAETVDAVEAEPLRPFTASDGTWTFRQMMSVAQRALAVLVVMGIVGYGLGLLRGSSNVARTEFVYTLDESVPDSFLREDRRLLTQVVTFKSDSVLTPVAEDFGLTVDDLRAKIDVQTLELSEVLRLDVSDRDPATAIAISRAVLDQYLDVITDATPAGDSQELDQRRTEIVEQLATADTERRGLLQARQRDVTLELQQESIGRQIDLRNEQINRIQGSLDDSLVQNLSAVRKAALAEELTVAQDELAALELDLAAVGAERAELATATTVEPGLLREIERLEAKLTTIDEELAERELAPLVAAPIRELSRPLIIFRSADHFARQGMAIAMLAGIPIAALVAYRTRRRQLWFD